MPFKSEKQRRFMFANHPKIAHRWAHEDPADSGEYGEPPKKKRKKHDWKAEEKKR